MTWLAIPAVLIGNWCLDIARMSDAFVYRRCDLAKADMMIREDGFDAHETSCQLDALNKIERDGWSASFKCTGAGVEWREEDVITFERGLLKIHVKINKAKRISDPMIRYCLMSQC